MTKTVSEQGDSVTDAQAVGESQNPKTPSVGKAVGSGSKWLQPNENLE